MVRIGVIGCGYWGPNYIRIFNELKESRVLCCCDLEERNLAKIKKIYQNIAVTKDYKKVARNPHVDAVVITTPLDSHYEIARWCLKSGKHVLVEKPFTATLEGGRELVKIAEGKKLCLMVGHVYEYNPGVRKLGEVMRTHKLGSIYYVHAERVGLGPIRKHANALWDLATHDISIALYLLNEFPEKVTATGESYIQENVKDLVFVTLKFPSGVICNIHASWFAPEKVRKITVVGSEGMAVFDDVNKSETLKIYEREVDKGLLDSTPQYSDHLAIVNIGDIYIPKVEQSEPLNNQAKHFLDCIVQKKKPLTDGKNGLDVVRVLEAAEKSLRSGKAVRCR